MKRLDELFGIRYGHSLELNRLTLATPNDGIPFVSRKMGDNGIAAYVKPLRGEEPYPAGELTCALSGNGVLTTFVQNRSYYTAFHVACLRPLVEMTDHQKLFYCLCIRTNRYRYSWGRQANRSLKNIMLPSLEEIPDWVQAIGDQQMFGKDNPITNAPVPHIDFSTWKPFRLSELFEIGRGQGISTPDRVKGETPYIGALKGNNGLVEYVDRQPLHPKNTITLNWNGIGGVGYAFYQPCPYWCSGDVSALYPRFEMTSAIAHFVITVIRKERYRFSFGRKLTTQRMSELIIHLPAIPDGRPDWDFMERYIKTLPFSSQL